MSIIEAPQPNQLRSARATAEPGELRFLLRNLGWARYGALLELLGDEAPRLAYAHGDVELMSPLIPHERWAKCLAFLVETIAEELDIPCDPLRSTTFRNEAIDRGVEPDECYQIAHAGALADQRRPDLTVDPPPDLVIEVEITSSLLDKLDIYAGLSVPELWRFDGATLTLLVLGPDGTYAPADRSRSFPFLTTREVVQHLDDFDPGRITTWRRSVRRWVRAVLLPRHRPDPAG